MATALELGIDDVYVTVTEIFGIEGDRVRSGEFRFACPVHDDSHPSCDVNLKTGRWNCWSCPAGGDLVDLGIAATTGKHKGDFPKKRYYMGKRAEIRKILQPNEPSAISAAIQRRVRSRRQSLSTPARASETPAVAIPYPDSYEDGPYGFLYERGFTDETIKRWGIRYVRDERLDRPDADPFTITHAIGIPLRSENGELLGWCYRATPKSERWFQNVRYIYTPGIKDRISSDWFGLHLHADAKKIYVCEGALDAIWLDQCGFPALAILGSNVKQVEKLRKLMRYKAVGLFLDRDTTGVWTTLTLGQELQSRGVPVWVCRYSAFMKNRKGEPAKDAQDLCPADVELAIGNAIPYLGWKQRNRPPS